MKTIHIEQVANGWLVRDHDECTLNSYKPGDIHVYRSIEELQKDLPELLKPPEPAQTAKAMSASEIETVLHRGIAKTPGLGVGTATHNPDGSLIF